PAYVMLGHIWNDHIHYNLTVDGPAYLGPAHRPFAPTNSQALCLNGGVTPGRLQERKTLLRSFDTLRRDVDDTLGNGAAHDAFTAQALELISAGKARDAFDLDREPDRVRRRYGLLPELLQARRLAEAGVPLITIEPGQFARGPTGMAWDHHNAIFFGLKQMLP